MSLSAKPLANAVAGTDYIVAIVDGPVTSRMFGNVTYTVGSTLPALGSTNYSVGVPSGMTGFPQLQSLTATAASDGTNTEMGRLNVVLAPNAADVVNAASPMNYTYSGNALAITASTSTG